MRYRNSFGISHFTLENYTVTHCVPTNCTLCANRPLTKMSTFPSLDRLDCFTHLLTRSVGRSISISVIGNLSVCGDPITLPPLSPLSVSLLSLSCLSALQTDRFGSIAGRTKWNCRSDEREGRAEKGREEEEEREREREGERRREREQRNSK